MEHSLHFRSKFSKPFVAVALSGFATNRPVSSDIWGSSPGTCSVMGVESINQRGQISAGSHDNQMTRQQTGYRRQQETSRPSKPPKQQSSHSAFTVEKKTICWSSGKLQNLLQNLLLLLNRSLYKSHPLSSEIHSVLWLFTTETQQQSFIMPLLLHCTNPLGPSDKWQATKEPPGTGWPQGVKKLLRSRLKTSHLGWLCAIFCQNISWSCRLLSWQ